MSGIKYTDLIRIEKIKIRLEAQDEIDAFIEKIISLPPAIKGYESQKKKVYKN